MRSGHLRTLACESIDTQDCHSQTCDSQSCVRMKTWSEREYADPVPYLRHRAELILALGPPLRPGDRLCDLACGDGGLADFLPGIEYLGVDDDPKMAEEARSKGRELVLADLNDFEPDRPVAATTTFRALYYAHDRPAFFRRVA